jgi:hypothetical protein
MYDAGIIGWAMTECCRSAIRASVDAGAAPDAEKLTTRTTRSSGAGLCHRHNQGGNARLPEIRAALRKRWQEHQDGLVDGTAPATGSRTLNPRLLVGGGCAGSYTQGWAISRGVAVSLSGNEVSGRAHQINRTVMVNLVPSGATGIFR